MKFSAIIITKNEEDTIARCLTSVSFADEIIVVDAESSDQTTQIAQKMGATVFVRPWPGYGEQKNFGRDQAQSDWLLFIDADEEVTPELRQEIQKVITNYESRLPSEALAKDGITNQEFYWLRIVTVFLGRPLYHMFGHNPRLMRKNSGRWTDAQVHEQVETNMGTQLTLGDDHSGILTSPLLHHSHQTIAAYLATMHHYTTLDAEEMMKTNEHRSGRPVSKRWWLPLYLAARQLGKLLLYRRGILDGPAGWLWCLLSAYYEFEMGRKYLSQKTT